MIYTFTRVHFLKIRYISAILVVLVMIVLVVVIDHTLYTYIE